MKKVIFNKKEEIEEWISVDEPRFRYVTIMGALKWAHEIYETRKFIVGTSVPSNPVIYDVS